MGSKHFMYTKPWNFLVKVIDLITSCFVALTGRRERETGGRKKKEGKRNKKMEKKTRKKRNVK